ncbi:hypothetical protein F3Y22_tig00010927pilonHSYRG00135 [Hibiscus syriacus]|uniref:Chromo domain-containing protein n=1 Tax=Hibiscus syriacus TaxID=106335 RepID=A0A6A3C5K3_HIBSY|nr:hypothetical protein F3Y22_tig00010927pilonHSYRG00135 [Hibiscus syriacus]
MMAKKTGIAWLLMVCLILGTLTIRVTSDGGVIDNPNCFNNCLKKLPFIGIFFCESVKASTSCTYLVRMAGNSSESTVAEERGREAAPTNPKKKRDQSKAREGASLEPMVVEFGERLERVQHDFKTLEDHVLEQVDTLIGNAEETNNEVEARFIRLEDIIQAIRESIEGIREDLTLCKRAAVSGGANNVSTSRVEFPKPQGFNGARDAKEVENYLWQMEQYFKGIGLNDEATMVKTAALYLSDTAITQEALLSRECGIQGSQEIVELKQRGIMRDYVKEFTTLMLQIPNMSEDDLLFYFIDGLQGWAKQEIHRRDIRTVDEALVIVESLVDFQPYSHTNATKNKDKYPAKGPHPMSSYPKLGSLSAIVDRQDTESQAEMRSLQVLNALKAKSLTPTPSNGLMYVEALINEKLTRAMVDTGATHNFVSKDKANRLGLKYTGAQDGSRRKIHKRYHSMAWHVTAIPMPSFSSVCILEKGSPYMIPMVEAPKEQGRDAKQLSAIQLCRGIKKGAMTYLTMLKEDDEIKKTDDLPPIIREVLEENKDVMPPELPNKLPLRREVDHKIELEPGAKSSALAPHQMAPPKLEELRSNSMEEHIDHLRIVFKILRENELYVKKEKCTFATEEVQFLGHVIGHGKLLMDGNKIKAITEWEPPTKVSEMRSFLGLVNYYRRFIQGYSVQASPLTDLLKKGKAWEWSEQCQKAFEDLTTAVSQEPILALPDFTILFKVHTDASDFAIGGVLMQEGHPIAFESRKLNDTKRRYTVQEKEMTTIIYCLRIWRHYLLGAHFTIKTNNVATSYFQTQKKLSPKQARWQEFLAEFNYTLEYKLGEANVIANALSRKIELVAISLAKGIMLERIKEGYEQDPMTRELFKLASNGKTQRFWVEDGLLYTKGRRIYVPKWDNLRRDLIKECHDTKWPGHPGQKCTMALLETAYFWPHIRIAWSFTALPKSEGYSSIMVVVDRFSKYGTFMRCPKDCTAEEATRAFFKNVHFVSANRRDWEKLLDVGQFSYNLRWIEDTGRSPFKLATGQQPLTPHTLTMPLDEGKSPGATKMANLWEENANIARTCLEKERKKMKKWADEKSMLKPYHADKEDPSRGYSHRAPPVVTKSYDKEVEMVLTSRTVRKRGVTPRTEYLIKWKRLPESEATWELAEDLWQFVEHLKAYEETRTMPE